MVISGPACTLSNGFVASRVVEVCGNGIDDDGDGDIDCADIACQGSPGCDEGAGAWCGDGVDNDFDGATDCADPDCVEFPVCVEAGRCEDGEDNDLDDLTDCEDPDCDLFLPCVVTTPFVREAPCPPGRPAVSISQDFVEGEPPDPQQWLGGDLDSEGWRFTATHRTFGLGARQPLSLEVRYRFHQPEVCFAADPRLCTGQLTLRVGGADGVLDLLIVRMILVDRELVASCLFHDLAAGSAQSVRLPAGPAPEMVLALETEELLDGRASLAVSWRSEGIRILACPAIPLPALEPEVGLVLSTGFRAAGDPPAFKAFQPVHARIDAAAELTAERCGGLRTPLLPDEFCEFDSTRNKGLIRLRVARSDAGVFSMLLQHEHHVPAELGLRAMTIGQATSPDGRTGWADRFVDNAFQYGGWVAPLALGGHRFDPATRSWEAWYSTERLGPGAVRMRAAQTLPMAWKQDGDRVRVLAALTEAPDSTVVGPDGVLQGFTTMRSLQGRPAVHRLLLRPEDGAWSDDGPVLIGRQLADLQGQAPSRPDVRWDEARGHYVMVFETARYGWPAGIGLAFSKDGRTWVEHADNPVIVGEDPGLDLGGAESPSLVIDGGALRVWYVGVSESPIQCPNGAGVSAARRPVGTELTADR